MLRHTALRQTLLISILKADFCQIAADLEAAGQPSFDRVVDGTGRVTPLNAHDAESHDHASVLFNVSIVHTFLLCPFQNEFLPGHNGELAFICR